MLTVALAVLFSLTAAAAGAVIGARSAGAAAVAAAVTATALAPVRGRVLAVVQRSLLGLAGDPERAAALVDRRLAAIEDVDPLATRAADRSVTCCGCPEWWFCREVNVRRDLLRSLCRYVTTASSSVYWGCPAR